ncbi:MAG TPA: amino acid adenylation domain-containing protein [Pyrinomonadaceae bacterium]|nr:amino acid adenylation domain-containing protein [Pyrinomonadaceae bacterium]
MSRNLAKVSDLSLKERRALLSRLFREERDSAETFPVSFAQQRLWFLAQLEPNNHSYNVPQTLRLKGVLNFNALEQTINAIIARHESLRTTFKAIDGQPVQIVSGAHEIKLLFADLKGLPEAEREGEARQLAIAEARRPFDLSRDHPLRAVLVRIEDDDHWLLLTMHHIVSDGWSMGILRRELSSIYEAIATNQRIDLSELPVQYADFAEWQREWLQGKVLEEQLGYWLKSLAGAPSVLKLPTDHPRPARQSFQGASLSLKLSQKLSRALGEFSQREGVTLFMTTLAAFQTLLFRYTGQEDIVVGTPIAGRNRVEIESLIGFFVNTLALRTNVSGNPTFRQLLGRVREVALGAYAHQDLPFEKLVEELNPERDVSHSPVFQVIFGMQNAPREMPTLSGLTITRVALASRTAKFDLTLFLSETASGLNCWLEYNTDLFEETTISRMLGHFERLLEGIVADPERPILQLPLLTNAERTQLLTERNGTHADFPREPIHKVFERQVELTPNSIAVVSETGQLSYVELDRRANQLAHYLRKLGVGPDDIVGLCVERSPEMLVGLLGILKAGGAYLPLDPAYPEDRLSFMLEDGGAKVLLTQEHLQERLPAHHAETIFIDRDWAAIAGEREDSPDSIGTAENLAYVMYTSGSTGKPKAVGITHPSVVRLVKNTNYIQFGPHEVFLQFAPLSFDASTFEIWGSLLNGGRLVVMPPGLVSLANLGEAVRQHGVTTLWLTSGLFQQMIETELESLRGVRQLLAGGDALSVPHVEQVARELKGCQLINGYGPTENTTFTCCYRVKPGERFAGSIPIGFPISNTQVYILDAQLEPVPIGVVGELYAGGAGLALGYLNDSALTAERFVPDPLSQHLGARLYRTGDLARYRADGSIEFLGRIDHQVKLRGHRIELGEIETALRQYPAVQDAVVTLHHAANGNKHLVGYVVADSNDSEFHMASELKGLLKKTLPDYMVPAYFVFLEKLPLTPSGKIDRRALPAPSGARPELEKAHIAPRDDLERRLAHIWERILGVQSVGIRDNFFDLGGHSLLAVRLVAEIEKELGQRLPLVSFFQDPSIEYLASLLRQDVSSLSWPTLVEIQAGGPNVPPLFCVSMPNVNALGYRSLARYLGANQPVFGLQAQYPEDLEGEHSQAAVNRIATEYLEALRAVRPMGPYQFIGLCRGAHIAYEMARSLEREGQEIALLGVIDTWVMENTYNYFYILSYYARRLVWLTLLGLRKQFSFIKKKAKGKPNISDKTSTSVPEYSEERKEKPIEVYFPGPDFVPTTYEGRIAVFRARRQPRNRVRDPHLGWGKLAKGGVDIHFIPGDHDDVLKEPHVQGLAAELKKYLRQKSEQASS